MVQIMDQRRHHQQVAIMGAQPVRAGKNGRRHHNMRKMAGMVISVSGSLARGKSDEPGDRSV